MNHIRTMLSGQALKAWVAAGVATIGAATVAAPGGITLTEALTIVGAGLGAFQATYWTTNAYPPINVNGLGDPPNKGVDARTLETVAPETAASATPIHDALAAQYDVATPVEPQP